MANKPAKPRGIGIKILSALLYAFVFYFVAELVHTIVSLVTGPFPPEWGYLLFIIILCGGYKGFTRVPKKR